MLCMPLDVVFLCDIKDLPKYFWNPGAHWARLQDFLHLLIVEPGISRRAFTPNHSFLKVGLLKTVWHDRGACIPKKLNYKGRSLQAGFLGREAHTVKEEFWEVAFLRAVTPYRSLLNRESLWRINFWSCFALTTACSPKSYCGENTWNRSAKRETHKFLRSETC